MKKASKGHVLLHVEHKRNDRIQIMIQPQVLHALKSAQALGRAVSRANRALGKALPHTPKRKRAVVQRLSQRFQMEGGTASDEFPTRTVARTTSEKTVDLVKAFYERNESSRQAPGRKDVVIIRGTGGTKSKIQA